MLKSASRIDKALGIQGWMSESELIWLADSASLCSRIIEFGSYHGRSTRAMADNIQEGGIIWAVDPWGGKYMTDDGRDITNIDTYVLPTFKKNLFDHISNGTVIPIRGYSHSFSLDVKVDMIFIDGDHRYLSVLKDIERARELVKPGGIISGHDYNHPVWPHVSQAVNEEFGIENLQFAGESIWWIRIG